MEKGKEEAVVVRQRRWVLDSVVTLIKAFLSIQPSLCYAHTHC